MREDVQMPKSTREGRCSGTFYLNGEYGWEMYKEVQASSLDVSLG